MEHHSNHTSWIETNVDVVVLKPNKELRVDLDELRNQLEIHKERPFKNWCIYSLFQCYRY